MYNILEKSYKAGLKFLVPLNLEETYKLIVDEAVEIVKADYGSILLEDEGVLKRAYATSPTFYKIKPQSKNIMEDAFRTQKSVLLTSKDLEKEAITYPQLKQLGIKSDLITPLSYKNKPIGVLTIMSKKENHFSEKEVKVLRLFSQIASLGIRKAQLNEETARALEARDLFISMAAHELRTPLTTNLGREPRLFKDGGECLPVA